MHLIFSCDSIRQFELLRRLHRDICSVCSCHPWPFLRYPPGYGGRIDSRHAIVTAVLGSFGGYIVIFVLFVAVTHDHFSVIPLAMTAASTPSMLL